MRGVRIDAAGLDVVLPMHLVFDSAGRILHAGPGLTRMSGPLTGRRLDEALRVRRPQMGAPVEVLAQSGRRIIVELYLPGEGEDGRRDVQRLRAACVPLPQGGGLVQFAFGPDLAQGVRAHALSAQHFSPIDPALELLYLLEAQALVRAQLHGLAGRLDAARRAAEAEAATDRLTGLSNRRALERALGNLVRPGGGAFGLMHLDLDHFKEVNDSLGHAAGDAVLAEVAEILREETRRGDIVARMGGDEFVLVFPGCGDEGTLGAIGERILARLAQPIPFRGRTCRISGSIGVTSWPGRAVPAPGDVPPIERLLAEADAALYRAKAAGRARCLFHAAGRDGHMGATPAQSGRAAPGPAGRDADDGADDSTTDVALREGAERPADTARRADAIADAAQGSRDGGGTGASGACGEDRAEAASAGDAGPTGTAAPHAAPPASSAPPSAPGATARAAAAPRSTDLHAAPG